MFIGSRDNDKFDYYHTSHPDWFIYQVTLKICQSKYTLYTKVRQPCQITLVVAHEENPFSRMTVLGVHVEMDIIVLCLKCVFCHFRR